MTARSNLRIVPWSAVCWSLEHWDGYQWRTLENYWTYADARQALLDYLP